MKKIYMLVAVLLMLVGFAALSTTLYLSGSTNIIGNKDDFKVYYSDAKVNGVQDLSIVESEASLRFSTELDTLGQTYVIEYDVTNSSKNYDADLTMVCTGGDEYLSVVNNFDDTTNLPATETRVGTLTLTLAKTYTGADYDVDIECTITANAVERTSLGTGTPADPVKVCKWEYEDLDESGTLTLGDKYGYCDDQFYVTNVGDENVELLTAAPLTGEYRQAGAGEYGDYVFFFGYGFGIPPWPRPSATFDIDIRTYSADNIIPYIDGYVDYLINLTGDNSITGDLINIERLSDLGCDIETYTCATSSFASWINLGVDEMWWTKTGIDWDYGNVYSVKELYIWDTITSFGHAEQADVRPVITISRDTLDTLTNTSSILDAQTFCESKGYPYGSVRPSTYGLMNSFEEEGDESLAYYLCNVDEELSEIYGYDLEGNLVYTYKANY